MTSVREYSNKPHGNMGVEISKFNLRRDYLKKTLHETTKKNLENTGI